MNDPPSATPERVRELLAEFLADPGADFEAFAQTHPEHAAELRVLRERVRRVEAGLGGEADPVRLGGRAAERYEVGSEVGRGSMSHVHAAFDRLLRRDLALKISSPALSDEQSKRFEREAELTASLDHPGIVPVHDIGVTADARPFFAMKRVRGESLARVYERVRAADPDWLIARAIGVLLRVAETISFAHARGVIHRDLKPANVMVGEYGEVYVMDWGLARASAGAVGGGGGADPRATRAGSALGTPAYMAPEQAAGDSARIGPRSDVYALGALLYELLAGHPPFLEPGGSTSASAVLERLRSGSPSEVNAQGERVPAALIAIQQRAMQRNEQARYPSAAEFATDLRAWLEGRVVRAYEHGAWAELRAWARRNRALAATSVALVLAVVGAALGWAWQQHVAAESERAHSEHLVALNLELEHARVAAQAEALASEQAFEFLSGMFTATDPEHARGRDVPARELLDGASARLLDGNAPLSPELRVRMLLRVGEWYIALGRVTEAERVFDAALTRFVAAATPLQRCAARAGSASVLRAKGKLVDARGAYEALLSDLREQLPEQRLRAREVERALADVLELQGEYAAARSIYRRQSEDPELASSELRGVRRGLARVQRYLGQHDEAIAGLRRVLFDSEADAGPDGLDTLQDLLSLGSALKEVGQLDECEKLYRRALDAYERALGPAHLETWVARHNLGDLYWRQGRYAQAEPLLREVVEHARGAYGDDHFLSIDAMSGLAGVLRMLDRTAEARELIEEALSASVRVRGEDHLLTLGLRNNLAALCSDAGDQEGAIEQYGLVADRLAARFGENHDKVLLVRLNRAEALDDAGHFEEAWNGYAEVLERATAVGAAGAPLLLRGEELYGRSLLRRRRAPEAVPVLERAWSRRRDLHGERAAKTLQARTVLAQALLLAGQAEQALAHARAALEATAAEDAASGQAREKLCAEIEAALATAPRDH